MSKYNFVVPPEKSFSNCQSVTLARFQRDKRGLAERTLVGLFCLDFTHLWLSSYGHIYFDGRIGSVAMNMLLEPEVAASIPVKKYTKCREIFKHTCILL